MNDAFVSIVAPVRDAALYVEDAVAEIEGVLRGLFRHYEIVLVDDASSDATVEIVRRLQRRVENLQLYCLNRRSGLDVALVAGLDNSIGDFVVTLNVQTDPANLIPVLWRRSRDGNSVVCGVRNGIPRHGFRAWASRAFYRLLFMATGLRIPPGISDLRLYSRQVVGYITQNNDRHLLLRVLPFFTSHRIAVLEYSTIERGQGFGRRGPSHAILSGLTILLSSSSLPLRMLTLLSVTASTLSLLFAFYVVAVALLKRHVVEGWVSIALPMAVMFFFLSTILGVLSEYIYMLVQQSGNRPVYLISEESTSSVLGVRRKLNVVDATGEFSAASVSAAADPPESARSETAQEVLLRAAQGHG